MKYNIESRMRKIYRRHILYLDYAALSAAYFLAIFSRYIFLAPFYERTKGIQGLYVSLFMVLLLINVVLSYTKGSKWGLPVEQSRTEIIFTVIKTQIYFLLILLIYLFIAKWSSRVSRTVIAAFFIYNTIFDSAIRIWYRRRILGKIRNDSIYQKLLLITDKKHESVIRHQMLELGGGIVDKVITVEDMAGNIDDELTLDDSDLNYERAVIYLPDSKPEKVGTVAEMLASKNIPSDVIITFEGGRVSHKSINSSVGYNAIRYTAMLRKGVVLGVNYTVSNISEAVTYVRNHLDLLKGQYICFSNVHTTVMSYDREDVREAENSSALTFPDGAPIARLLRHDTDTEAVRMPGPDFMEEMLKASMDGQTTHYFYGSTQETLDKLKANIERKYPGTIVKGYYSPPFRDLSDAEEDEMIDMINKADPDIIWIGLGAPRQEKWMLAHKGKFRGVCVGVGAAFDFHAGTIKRAPIWVQLIGLEWLYRMLQNPERLVKRYFFTNIRFMWLIATGRNKKK
ncbi:polymer biosynthesis protein, WecB/TagA/CpsF family [Butyrivibrio fibrisolvens DSM 3071]|uniref:Polymer biosynthesis protein, WecB/TagA/CpsF family n=2 Tax=Butyrivibrio fibrisolvens TaxID=831 RepID=A0A1M6A9I8_BUTFI|nr:polymer biosynthesis protein, WecB/TagA/CpsF family [Butyrivibrio fibrisolvens DSM 3071]